MYTPSPQIVDLRSAAPAEFMTRPLVKPEVKAVRDGYSG
jgi:hypothetical protein